MELHLVQYEVGDGVAIVTLNRPDRLNAWTARMATEFRWCLGTADEDGDVRVIVVTGAGRGFCAGADTRALDAIARSGQYRAADDEAERPDGGGAGGRGGGRGAHPRGAGGRGRVRAGARTSSTPSPICSGPESR